MTFKYDLDLQGQILAKLLSPEWWRVGVGVGVGVGGGGGVGGWGGGGGVGGGGVGGGGGGAIDIEHRDVSR